MFYLIYHPYLVLTVDPTVFVAFSSSSARFSLGSSMNIVVIVSSATFDLEYFHSLRNYPPSLFSNYLHRRIQGRLLQFISGFSVSVVTSPLLLLIFVFVLSSFCKSWLNYLVVCLLPPPPAENQDYDLLNRSTFFLFSALNLFLFFDFFINISV